MKILKKTIAVLTIILLLLTSKISFASSSNYATSNVYLVNEEYRYIYNVDVDTSVINFFSNLSINTLLSFHVYDKDGNKKADGQRLATGDLFMFKNREQYKISVSKDLSGDGYVTIRDLARLQRQILEPNEEISIEAFLAGDTNNDDTLTIRDLAALQRYILNK